MINLTSAFNPGDVDSGKLYTHLKIIEFRFKTTQKEFLIVCKYGYLDSGNWIAGKVQHQLVSVTGQDAIDLIIDSVAVVTDVADPGPPAVSPYNVYTGASRNLYQYLIDNGHYAGTYVTS